MPRPSFRKWLEHRVQEVPDIGTLALRIAQAGAAGVSLYQLRKVMRASPETLESMLRALVVSRQVVVVKVGQQLVYRAVG